ncbi:phosphatase PAP2 family protein [Clostridium sp. MCC353]|uniref:phosphatase PAP2 family protein n=1 Tax=Clostridium sp. MCC353 TaxID=2592646 RepID=UPI001C029534|nr:phosphatase PAP2 family protein [Clostridium sp. MCC353]MBT9777528.1 phosphatase PAP2 family protein [Clostridium sp. MCC353]
MKNLIRKYKHVWILSYAFLYLPWFLYLERTVTRNYYVMHVALDDWIPFSEYFIIPYLLWFLYVSGAILYFFFTNKQDYYRLCIFLFTGMTISLLICTVFENGTDLRPVVDPGKNFCSWLVSVLHSADTSTNVFPSIHAYNSIGVHIAVMHSEALKKYRIIRWGSFILMILICLSTVYLKQHSVVDVAGSLIMAYIIYPLVYGTDYAANRKKVTQKALG